MNLIVGPRYNTYHGSAWRFIR